MVLAVALVAACVHAVRELRAAADAGSEVLVERDPTAPAPRLENVARRADQDLPGWVREVLDRALTSRYVDFEVIGSGGMATVLKAFDSQLERPVAIKVPPPHLCDVEGFRTRFIREARALARLDHENIAEVFDVPEVPEGEVPVIVMELLEGQDLSSRFKEKGVGGIAETLGWVLQAGEALQYAHDNGVVHRDVKPANLMLVDDGRVKVLDFGLAAMDDHSKITKSGMRLGTIAYMTPEQYRGERVGPVADQYALAASAFRLLTGELPYDLKDRFRMTIRRASEYRPEVPAAADQVFAKALSGFPDERYPSMREFLAALRFALEVA